jgi:hypothetical protein
VFWAVEHLPNKCEALYFSTVKKKEEKGKKTHSWKLTCFKNCINAFLGQFSQWPEYLPLGSTLSSSLLSFLPTSPSFSLLSFPLPSLLSSTLSFPISQGPLCSQGCPHTVCVSQTDLKLKISLPWPPYCWNYRCAPHTWLFQLLLKDFVIFQHHHTGDQGYNTWTLERHTQTMSKPYQGVRKNRLSSHWIFCLKFVFFPPYASWQSNL